MQTSLSIRSKSRLGPFASLRIFDRSVALPRAVLSLRRAIRRGGLLSLLLLFGACATPDMSHAETDSARVARLFMWASDGNVRHRDFVAPAKDSLGLMGAKAAPWLAKKLYTTDARERLTLAEVFEKIGTAGTAAILPYLEAEGEDAPRNTARCLERIKDTAAVVPLLAQMDHPEYSVRSQVATALGKTKHHMALDSLIHHLSKDPDSDVRKSCAVAIGDCGGHDGVEALVAALSDSSFGVRQSGLTALIKLKAPEPLLDVTSESADDAVARHASIVAICAIDEPRSEKVINHLLTSDDPLTRAFAVEGLGQGNALQYQDVVAKTMARETDPFVLAQIARFEQIVLEKKNAESKPE